ncbi:MAG: hypothetical protein ACFE94_09715 [Candidatus Hodarchaeota archaeon]
MNIFETFKELELALNMIKKNQASKWIISVIVAIIAIFLVSITFIILKSLKRNVEKLREKEKLGGTINC